MELMNFLSVCTLAALVPQALGHSNAQTINDSVFNNSIVIKNDSLSLKNVTTPSTQNELIYKTSNIDIPCKNCHGCIQKAIQSHVISSHLKTESYLNLLDQEDSKKRIKRKTALNTAQSITDKKSKKIKFKRNKTISIIKYNNSGRIYALKVKEIQTSAIKNNSITTCQVYSIQNHFPCESPDADLILTASNRKIKKNSKKKRSKRQKNVSNTKTTVIAPAFSKSQIDSSQVPEQIMPSIEEMY